METALSTIQLLPLTKDQRKHFVQKAVDEITSGEYNPLQVEIWLKSVEDTISDIRKDRDVKTVLQNEVDLYTENTFTAFGANVTKAKRTTKDFTVCNDTVLNELNSQLEKLKNMIKARELMIEMGINPDTGEVCIPPAKKTTEFLKIEIA